MRWLGSGPVGTVSVDKANFDDIYDQPDPRAYFNALGDLAYAIPQHAHPVFARVLRAQQRGATEQMSVLDVGCSYGLNAALLRCDLSMRDLFDHYGDRRLAELSPEELAATDRSFYADHRRDASPRLLGVDLAARALAYAERVGLLDASWAENLESNEPSAELSASIADVDLITSTGCVGYITEKTFGRLMDAAANDPPWVATFVLRMFDYDQIAAVLAEHGLVTEKLDGVTFKQRRFASPHEQASVAAALHDRGLDPRGKEDDGWFHAEFFLSRPAHDAGVPVADLVADARRGEAIAVASRA